VNAEEVESKPNVGKKIIAIAILFILIVAATFLIIRWGENSDEPPIPLGLSDQGHDNTTVFTMIKSAPTGALIDGSIYSFDHNNVEVPVDKVTVYWPNATIGAVYTPINGWLFTHGTNAAELTYKPGMKIDVIVNAGVSPGDRLTVSSIEEYFGPTIHVI